MPNFIVTDRKTDYLLPPSLDDWLNQDHLARFSVEVIDDLDLSNLIGQYAGGDRKRTLRRPCWRFWSRATPRVSSPVASWSG